MNAMDFADETTVEFHSACAPVPGQGDGRADADFIGSQVGSDAQMEEPTVLRILRQVPFARNVRMKANI